MHVYRGDCSWPLRAILPEKRGLNDGKVELLICHAAACRRNPIEWCARVESNHHSFRNTDLNRARLPIPPRAPIGGRAETSCPRIHVNRAGRFAGLGRYYLREPPVSGAKSSAASVASAAREADRIYIMCPPS